ncbi:hypothetical protein Q5P01_011559 [Channa striata]|uniref:Uncharacterized protein n=1 Tax=Channa striata TaxID=64152 RepID=A0AA88SN00_CHASR|nr:hypothetical protein Q5P01_011559 [Channa striata]
MTGVCRLYSVDTVYRPSQPRRAPPPQKRVQKPGAAAGLVNYPSFFLHLTAPHTRSVDMIIRLGRLTPGYFRLLQRQVAGEVQMQPQDRAVNQIAMMLAIIGLSMSYYSAKQMTEKVQAQPAP